MASLIIGAIAVTAALCELPTFIICLKLEPTLKQYLIRHLIQLILIEKIVLVMIEVPESENKVLFYVIIGVIVLIIYMLAKWMLRLQKYMHSKKPTEQLKKQQSSE